MNTDQMSPREQAVVDHLITKHMMNHADPQVMSRRVSNDGLSPIELQAAKEEELFGKQTMQGLDEGHKLMALTRQIQNQTQVDQQVNSAILEHLGVI